LEVVENNKTTETSHEISELKKRMENLLDHNLYEILSYTLSEPNPQLFGELCGVCRTFYQILKAPMFWATTFLSMKVHIDSQDVHLPPFSLGVKTVNLKIGKDHLRSWNVEFFSKLSKSLPNLKNLVVAIWDLEDSGFIHSDFYQKVVEYFPSLNYYGEIGITHRQSLLPLLQLKQLTEVAIHKVDRKALEELQFFPPVVSINLLNLSESMLNTNYFCNIRELFLLLEEEKTFELLATLDTLLPSFTEVTFDYHLPGRVKDISKV
jgi:hypothetical protein